MYYIIYVLQYYIIYIFIIYLYYNTICHVQNELEIKFIILKLKIKYIKYTNKNFDYYSHLNSTLVRVLDV